MSSRDFQIALARLIASPQLCERTLVNEEPFFNRYSLCDREKKRLHAVLRQRGISACCSLYRMNRITPIYTQLSNTSLLLNDDLVPLVEEFWLLHADTSLQFREEVSEFGRFLMAKIDQKVVRLPYLKEVLLLEITLNKLSYLPEGELLYIKFDYDIYEILQSLNNGSLKSAIIHPASTLYKLSLRNQKVQMEVI